MNVYREENNSYCYFHPKEIVIGVCALCLNERLLVLAAKQGHLSSSTSTAYHHHHHHPKKTAIHFPKIFAFGSLLHRLEFRHSKSDDVFDDNKNHKSDASTSLEDSFISIKFEDNGAASWEKGINATVSKSLNHNFIKEEETEQPQVTKETMSVIEHSKPRGPLRWRKRIGHLFQVIKLNRSKKASMCHVGTKVEGAKVMRKGWIRSLTKRRTKEQL